MHAQLQPLSQGTSAAKCNLLPETAQREWLVHGTTPTISSRVLGSVQGKSLLHAHRRALSMSRDVKAAVQAGHHRDETFLILKMVDQFISATTRALSADWN
jgi:RNA:NAD 2'-phosphotransferase (TPT1/KptA family)